MSVLLVLVASLGPAALGVVVGVWLGRRRMIAVQTVLDVIAGADAPDFGPPCIHPGCLWARAKFRRQINNAMGNEVRPKEVP